MFEEKIIGIEKLLLDRKNYRIDFDRYKTIDEVIQRLYSDEKIVEMIEGIVSFGGLYPHEKLIVVQLEKDKYKVVEGNRRVLAVKSIVGEIKPPAEFEKKVASLVTKLSTEQIESLKNLGTVIYDVEDKTYLKILANKHSKLSYIRWGQISQWHFFKDLYDENLHNIDQTSSDLGKSRNEVESYIRFHNLFRYIRSLSYWDENHLRNEIESNTLEPTKFTRPLGYKSVQDALDLNFSKDYELEIPSGNKEIFNEILCRYTKAALLSTSNDNEYISTRTDTDQILSLINSWTTEILNRSKTGDNSNKDGSKDENQNTSKDGVEGKQNNDEGKQTMDENTSSGNSKKGKEPVMYFSDLKCTVDNQRLKRLTNELSKIKVKQFPAAAIMLTRSLLESALLYQIERKVLKPKNHEYNSKGGLKSILNYSLSVKQELFKDPKSANGLDYIRSSRYKDFMDDIVHSKWIDPKPDDVANIAGKIRELLKAILNGSA